MSGASPLEILHTYGPFQKTELIQNYLTNCWFNLGTLQCQLPKIIKNSSYVHNRGQTLQATYTM